ncbi:MAG: TonB-dependent receptor [Cyclobacteriaceae bacterium]
MKYLSCSYLLWLMSYYSMVYAQTGTISGNISNAGEAVEFATIGLQGTSFGAASDINGDFVIDKIPTGDYTLIVSSIGFLPHKQSISIDDKLGLELNIELTESTYKLDQVVVTGTMKEMSRLESPVPIEVFSGEFFKANPTPSVFESLQHVNGVRPQLNCNVCNTGDIHINGLEGPYTMILIDGMPIVSGLSTVYGLNGIPQALVDRIEVVKGPASTLYGSEAVGGLINIITKRPQAAPLVSADIFATDWQEYNIDLGVKYKISQNVESLLGINYFNYQNPVDNNNDGFTDLTLQNRVSIFNKLNILRKDDKTLSLAGRYVYENRWGGQMQWTEADRGGDQVYGESIYTNRWELFGVYQLPSRENIEFQFSANGHNQNSVYGELSYVADQYVGFSQLTWNKEIMNHDLLLGLSYRYTYYDDNTPATFNSNSNVNESAITHLPGLFLQNELQVNEQNNLLLGLRYDYNSQHGSILTPRLNYKWNSYDKMNIFRWSLGNGYRVANVFTEDHAALTGARDIVFASELQPETSWNTNINYVKKIYTIKNVFVGLDASAFYTYFSNRILPDYDTDPNQIIYDNLQGHSISKGVSLNMDVSWINGLKLLAGATLMDVSIVEDNKRSRQLLTESVQGVWSMGYTFQGIGLTVDYTGNLYGPMRLPLLGTEDNRDEYSPWWSIQNIQFTKTIGREWEIYGGVKNLLNFTPPSNSIARAFDPFDRGVEFDAQGQVIATPQNPNALTFDPTYVYASNQGIRGFLGVRYALFR